MERCGTLEDPNRLQSTPTRGGGTSFVELSSVDPDELVLLSDHRERSIEVVTL